MHILFFLTACVSIFAVVLICVFLFANGIPAIGEIGVFKFLLGTKWKPGNDIYGILPMILGSLYVTAGAILIGVPIGLLTAIFLAKFCPKGLYKILKPATELMLVCRPLCTASSVSLFWCRLYRTFSAWRATRC